MKKRYQSSVQKMIGTVFYMGRKPLLLYIQFRYQMGAVKNPVDKGFVLVSVAEPAAEFTDGIIVRQRQGMKKFSQFLKPSTNFRRITLVGVGICQIECVQHRVTAVIT